MKLKEFLNDNFEYIWGILGIVSTLYALYIILVYTDEIRFLIYECFSIICFAFSRISFIESKLEKMKKNE